MPQSAQTTAPARDAMRPVSQTLHVTRGVLLEGWKLPASQSTHALLASTCCLPAAHRVHFAPARVPSSSWCHPSRHGEHGVTVELNSSPALQFAQRWCSVAFEPLSATKRPGAHARQTLLGGPLSGMTVRMSG